MKLPALHVFLSLALCAATVSCDDDGADTDESATPAPRAAKPAGEAKKLAALIGKKTVSCTPSGDNRLSRSTGPFQLSVKKGAAVVKSQSLIAQPVEQVDELHVGDDTVMVQVSGTDGDEGAAVILLSSFDLSGGQGREAFIASAVIYGETGPGDGSGELARFDCTIK